MADSWETNEIAYAHILTKAWLDKDFKDRLIKHPVSVLKANGFSVPPNAHVQMVDANTNVEWDPSSATLKLPIPTRPAHLSDAEILTQDAGNSVTVCSSCCSCCA